jgi:hypothetical protein
MFHYLRRNLVILSTSSIYFATSLPNSHSDQENNAKPVTNRLILILSKESKNSIESHLESYGYKDFKAGNHVVVSPDCKDNELKALRSLMNQRVAYRCKGIVQPIDSDALAVSTRIYTLYWHHNSSS